MRDTAALHQKIRNFFRRRKPYEILDTCGYGGTFQAGGCYIGAQALARYLHAMGLRTQLYAVWWGGIAQHIVLKIGRDQYVDSHGVQTAQRLITAFNRNERVTGATLAPVSAKTVGEIWTNRYAVAELYADMVATWGNPKS